MKLAYIMPIIYILAGIMHFVKPTEYIKIMPKYLPYPKELVYISGLMEILFGTMLFFPATQRMGAWLIILLLILVFPANIQMAINMQEHKSTYFWISILRLPLQLVLIWWAFRYTQ